jgi:hypothetical protein
VGSTPTPATRPRQWQGSPTTVEAMGTGQKTQISTPKFNVSDGGSSNVRFPVVRLQAHILSRSLAQTLERVAQLVERTASTREPESGHRNHPALSTTQGGPKGS